MTTFTFKLSTAQKKRAHAWRHAPQRQTKFTPNKRWDITYLKKTWGYLRISGETNRNFYAPEKLFDEALLPDWERWLAVRGTLANLETPPTARDFAWALYTLITIDDDNDPDGILPFLDVMYRRALDVNTHPERVGILLDAFVELATLRTHVDTNASAHKPALSATEAHAVFFLRQKLCQIDEAHYTTLLEHADTLFGAHDHHLDVTLALLFPERTQWGDQIVETLLEAHRTQQVQRTNPLLATLLLSSGASLDYIQQMCDAGLFLTRQYTEWYWDCLLDFVAMHDDKARPLIIHLLTEAASPSLNHPAMLGVVQLDHDPDLIEALMTRMLTHFHDVNLHQKTRQKLLEHLSKAPDLVFELLPSLLQDPDHDRGAHDDLQKLLARLRSEQEAAASEQDAAQDYIDTTHLPEALTVLPWHTNTRRRSPKLPQFWRPLVYTSLILKQDPTKSLPKSFHDQIGQIFMKHEEDNLNEALDTLEALFDQTSLSAFCYDLYKDWTEAGAPAKHDWVSAMFLRFGKEELLDHYLPEIDRGYEGRNKKSTIELINTWADHIERDPYAVRMLEAITRGALSNASSHAKAKLAPRLKTHTPQLTHIDEIFDAYTPRLGLSDSRTLQIDGREDLEVVLDHKLDPHLKSNAELDPVTELKWQRIVHQHAHLAKSIARRLERALITGRRWSLETWRQHILEHPVTGHIARRLLWCTLEPRGQKPIACWRIDEGGELINIDDEPIAFTKKRLHVGLMHPLWFAQGEKERWAVVLADYQIIQPFEQVMRPVITEPPSIDEWKHFFKRTATHERLHHLYSMHQFDFLPQSDIFKTYEGLSQHLPLAHGQRTEHPFKLVLMPGIDPKHRRIPAAYTLTKIVNLRRIKWEKVDLVACSELYHGVKMTFSKDT